MDREEEAAYHSIIERISTHKALSKEAKETHRQDWMQANCRRKFIITVADRNGKDWNVNIEQIQPSPAGYALFLAWGADQQLKGSHKEVMRRLGKRVTRDALQISDDEILTLQERRENPQYSGRLSGSDHERDIPFDSDSVAEDEADIARKFRLDQMMKNKAKEAIDIHRFMQNCVKPQIITPLPAEDPEEAKREKAERDEEEEAFARANIEKLKAWELKNPKAPTPPFSTAYFNELN